MLMSSSPIGIMAKHWAESSQTIQVTKQVLNAYFSLQQHVPTTSAASVAVSVPPASSITTIPSTIVATEERRELVPSAAGVAGGPHVATEGVSSISAKSIERQKLADEMWNQFAELKNIYETHTGTEDEIKREMEPKIALLNANLQKLSHLHQELGMPHGNQLQFEDFLSDKPSQL